MIAIKVGVEGWPCASLAMGARHTISTGRGVNGQTPIQVATTKLPTVYGHGRTSATTISECATAPWGVSSPSHPPQGIPIQVSTVFDSMIGKGPGVGPVILP